MYDRFRLIINGAAIDTHPFIDKFIEHTVIGMLSALKNTGEVKDLDLSIQDNAVKINLNGALTPINAMTGNLIKGTILGMISIIQEPSETANLRIVIHK
jgi:hypothetical protein